YIPPSERAPCGMRYKPRPSARNTLVWAAVAGSGGWGAVRAGGQGTMEALMSQFGAQAAEAELHRGGWVEGPVRLYRDEWGIPHVRARSVHDVFVGQGYVHAM